MKSKKMLLGLLLSIVFGIGIFYACKKSESDSNVAENYANVNGQPGNSLSRGSGTKTYYSKDDSTNAYYKMVVSWSPAGQIIVNRSVITSGYPTGTDNAYILEDGLNISKIDNDSDTTYYDTLVVTFDNSKTYYQIGFEPISGGGYARITGGVKSHRWCHCKSSSGAPCSMHKTYNICYGCYKCIDQEVLDATDIYFGASGDALPKILRSGSILVEASSISIVN